MPSSDRRTDSAAIEELAGRSPDYECLTLVVSSIGDRSVLGN